MSKVKIKSLFSVLYFITFERIEDINIVKCTITANSYKNSR